MNNFAKHGQGDRVELALSKSESTLTLKIQDNGQGFDVKMVQKGLGLESMRERVELSGGIFTWSQPLAKGLPSEQSGKSHNARSGVLLFYWKVWDFEIYHNADVIFNPAGYFGFRVIGIRKPERCWL